MKFKNRIFSTGFLLIIFITGSTFGSAATLSIDGNRFYLDGEQIDVYGVRVASAVGKQDYTDQLIAQLDNYKSYGINAVTVFYMGSSGGHYDPFTADGEDWRHPEIRDRMDQIIEACAERSMICIPGIFYQWKTQELTDRSLSDWEAAKEAVRTVANHLEVQGYTNVMLNIANEQNSWGYEDEPWSRVSNVEDLLELVDIAKTEHPGLIVGCGGYDHQKNIEFGKDSRVDVLMFDTLGPGAQEDSGYYHDHFVSKGVVGKPIVNVETFGGWTKKFTPQGVYDLEGITYHVNEISQAAARPGLSVFFHSNPWFQGPSIGAPIRFDLGGQGTPADPGIRWWFEYLKNSFEGEAGDLPPAVNFRVPLEDADFPAPADLKVLVEASDLDGTVAHVELFINDEPVRRDFDSPYNWGPQTEGFDGLLRALSPGRYILKAVATDNAGLIAQSAISIRVTNGAAPVAVVTAGPLKGPSPLTVTFDASGSSDADNAIVKYHWDFGDGETDQGIRVTHTYRSPDTISLNTVLTVTDELGNSDSASISTDIVQPD